jgi:hypothetical protein
VSFNRNSSNLTSAYRDGVETGTAGSLSGGLTHDRLFKLNDTNAAEFFGGCQEVIIYNSDESDKRRAIEENIGSTYGITLPSSKDGTVSKWYDQSTTSGVPNANHAVQTSTGSQPKIVDGGSLIVGGLAFDGVNDRLSFTSSVALSSNDFFVTSVLKVLEGDGDDITPVGNVSGNRYLISLDYDNTTAAMRADGGSFLTEFFSASEPTGNILATVQRVSNTVTLFHQSSNQATFNATGESFTLGNFGQIFPTSYSKHLLSEIIIYDSDQSDNRTALEANIGEVYGIAGIPAYEDTVNGFVETWYDQSGNGNDATQLTAGNQPKIVDAGVLASGGILSDGAGTFLALNSALSISDEFDIFFTGTATASNWTSLQRSPYGFYTNADYPRFNDDSFRYTIAGSDSGTTNYNSGFTIGTGTPFLYNFNRDVSDSVGAQINGTAQTNRVTLTGTHQISQLFRRGANTSQVWDGTMSEMIFYPSDQSANRVAIEANINNQYDIY